MVSRYLSHPRVSLYTQTEHTTAMQNDYNDLEDKHNRLTETFRDKAKMYQRYYDLYRKLKMSRDSGWVGVGDIEVENMPPDDMQHRTTVQRQVNGTYMGAPPVPQSRAGSHGNGGFRGAGGQPINLQPYGNAVGRGGIHTSRMFLVFARPFVR
jgi:hypothetical protein